MTKKQLQDRAIELYNDCARLGLGSSYRSCLQSMYEVASEKKQYDKCLLITELIADDINDIDN